MEKDKEKTHMIGLNDHLDTLETCVFARPLEIEREESTISVHPPEEVSETDISEGDSSLTSTSQASTALGIRKRNEEIESCPKADLSYTNHCRKAKETPAETTSCEESLDMKVNTNPFARKDNVQRSPIKAINTALFGRERSGSLPAIYKIDEIKYTQTKIGLTGVKRQRDTEDTEDRNYENIIDLCTELSQIANNLCRLVGENVNTKVEIKNGVKHLKNRMDGLKRKMKDWGENTYQNHPKTRARAVDKNTQDLSTQTDEDIRDYNKQLDKEVVAAQIDRTAKNQSTQTASITIDQNSQINTDNEAISQLYDELRHKLEEGIDFNGLTQIIDVDWPEEIYKTTKLQKGNPMSLDRSWNIAVLAEPQKKGKKEKTKGVRKLLEKRYPEAVELLDDGTLGKLEFTVLINKF